MSTKENVLPIVDKKPVDCESQPLAVGRKPAICPNMVILSPYSHSDWTATQSLAIYGVVLALQKPLLANIKEGCHIISQRNLYQLNSACDIPSVVVVNAAIHKVG